MVATSLNSEDALGSGNSMTCKLCRSVRQCTYFASLTSCEGESVSATYTHFTNGVLMFNINSSYRS